MRKLLLFGNALSASVQRWAGWVVLLLSLVLTLLFWRFSVIELTGDHSIVSSLFLVAGLFSSALLSALVWSLIHTHRIAALMAHEMSETLRRSEERWSLALAGLGAGVTDWNMVTDETLYSPHWYDMLGHTADEIGNSSDEWMKRVHPDDMQHLIKQMELLLAGTVPAATLEFRMQCKDGGWKWVLGHAMVVSRDADGKAQRLIGTNLDIDSRKRAEATRDALFEALGDAGIGLFVLNHGKVVFANSAMMAITGYDIEELKALPDAITAGIHPDERRRVQQIHKQRLAGEQVSLCYETSIVTRSGERREIEMAVSIPSNSNDFHAFGIMTDITERKRLAARLQESHDLLSKISAQVPGVIFQFRLDPGGHFCFPFMSDSVEALYGVPAAEVRADANVLFSYLHPDDAPGITSSFLDSAETMTTWHHEYRVTLPKFGVRWMLGDARPEKLPDGRIVWHGVSTDITETKRMQEALRASEERFRSLTQMGADWYWEQDAAFRFTEISGGTTYEQIKSMSENALGKTRWELLSGHDDPEALDHHRRQVEMHQPFRNFEFSRYDDSGQYHCCPR